MKVSLFNRAVPACVGLAMTSCASTHGHPSSPGESTPERGRGGSPVMMASDRPKQEAFCSGGTPNAQARLVTLEDLVDNPERYLGVLVRVRAVAVLRFEASTLVTRSKILALEWTNIHFSEGPLECHRHDVIVEGRLDREKWRGADRLVFIAESMNAS